MKLPTALFCARLHAVSFRSLCAKFSPKFVKEFDKCVLVDVENMSELVKEDDLIEVLHNATAISRNTNNTTNTNPKHNKRLT